MNHCPKRYRCGLYISNDPTVWMLKLRRRLVHYLAVETYGVSNASALWTMTVPSTLSDGYVADWKTTSCVVVGTLASLYIVNAVHVWYRLRHIPGPLSVGWSKWWLIRAHVGGRTNLDLAEICEKYGIGALSYWPKIY